MDSNNTIHVTNSSDLLSKYMNSQSMSNNNLFRNDFPTENLYDGRIIFVKVPENMDSEE